MEEGVVAGRPEPRVRVREDRRRRLAAQVVDRVARVGEPAQRRRLLRDEGAHERPVLVERGPVAGRVLLEGERKLRAALGGERREAERAQGLVEVRCPDRHESFYAAARRISYAAPVYRPAPMAPERPQIEKPEGDKPFELGIEDLVVGDGEEAVNGSKVAVHYAGVAFSTGEEFDASWNRGEPFRFTLGRGSRDPGLGRGRRAG